MKTLTLIAVMAVIVLTSGCQLDWRGEACLKVLRKAEGAESRKAGNKFSSDERHGGNCVDRFLRREVGNKVNGRR